MHMSETKPIKVMIVDDHPVVRNGLKAMLLAIDDMELNGEAGSGKETSGPLPRIPARRDTDGHGYARHGWSGDHSCSPRPIS